MNRTNYKKISIAAIAFIVAVSALAAYSLLFVRFDYNFEHFLPKNDEDTEFFLDFRKTFETDNDFVLVGLRNKGGVFNHDFLLKVDSLVNEIDGIENVDTVLAPTRLLEYRKNFEIPYLRLAEPENLQKDSARIYRSPELIGSYFSQDAKSLLIYIKTKQYLSKEGCDKFSADLHELMQQSSFSEYHLAGRAIGEVYYIDLMMHEFRVFLATSLVLVVLFLIVAFRSLWAVWVPIVVVALSIVWIIALMTVLGTPLNFVLTMLPSIMFVVGMSDVVHIVSKYSEELRLGKTKIEAVKIAFREVGLATFFTSLTTAVGFFTLLFSTVEPVQDFGVYTGIGVFLAFILAFTLLPSAMILLPPPRVVRKSAASVWNKWLAATFMFTLRNKGKILAGFGIMLLVALFGVSKMQVNNYLLEGLTEGNHLRQEFNYFEHNFAGVRPFEMAVTVKDTSQSLYDHGVLTEMNKLQGFLENEYGAGSIASLVTVVKVANRAVNGGNEEYFSIPETETALRKIAKRLKNNEQMKLLVSEDETLARFSGRMHDVGWININKTDSALKEYYLANIDTSLIDYKLTGTAVLIDKNNHYLATSITQSLSVAFIVVAIIVGLLFRSVRMVLISFVPNIIPLLFIGGIMGFAGMELKVTNALIFTIAFGIAVDDTIHFISRLRLELQRGRTVAYAVKRSVLSTGKAIVITSLILSAGFLTLIYSDFLGTFQTGLLLGLTLLFAVLSDLVLLPILVLLLYKRR